MRPQRRSGARSKNWRSRTNSPAAIGSYAIRSPTEEAVDEHEEERLGVHEFTAKKLSEAVGPHQFTGGVDRSCDRVRQANTGATLLSSDCGSGACTPLLASPRFSITRPQLSHLYFPSAGVGRWG